MPLVGGLRCATEVAKALSDLHQQGRTHGRVTAANVLIKESGGESVLARGHWEESAPDYDVTAFGALLYEMILGARPPVDASAGNFRAPGSNSGMVGVRASAIRLAGKCLGYFPISLSMQQAATEIRLLWVLARQLEAGGAAEPPPMATPFLVAPAISRHKAKSKPKSPVAPPPVIDVRPLPPAREPDEDDFDLDLGTAEPVVQLAASDFTRTAAESKLGPRIAEGAPPCPKCDGAPVYESRPRTAFERRLVSWNIPICRCHRCYHRYIVVWSVRIHKSMPKHMERRFKPKRRS
jgi:hypothetical protein